MEDTINIQNHEAINRQWSTGEKVAVGAGVTFGVLVVAFAALTAYMHFSGMGFDKAGWATLGKGIKNFFDGSQQISNLHIAIVAGGAVATFVTFCIYRKYAHDPLAKKVNQLRLRYRTWLVERAQTKLDAIPRPSPNDRYDVNGVKRAQCRLTLVERIARKNDLALYMETNN